MGVQIGLLRGVRAQLCLRVVLSLPRIGARCHSLPGMWSVSAVRDLQAAMVALAPASAWMLNLGACLTLGLIPGILIGAVINAPTSLYGTAGNPSISWPIFWGVVALLASLGVGLLICKLVLACTYDPNAQDVETRKRLGQTAARLAARPLNPGRGSGIDPPRAHRGEPP